MAKLLAGLYGLIAFLMMCWVISPVLADPLKSTHYEFEESTLGGTSLIGSQSPNYQASGSGAILGLGNSASSNYQISAGGTTTGDPSLAFAITSASPSFGSFSPSTAATATATFQVIDYTSYGYIVQVIGTPPSNGGHTIAAMSTTGPSQAGVEQFGLNLVANTSPISLGANPDHGQFGIGSAAAGYDTPDNYRYVSGETIASAPKSSGQTTYTISYIVNVTSLTPGGQYEGNQTLICTGMF